MFALVDVEDAVAARVVDEVAAAEPPVAARVDGVALLAGEAEDRGDVEHHWGSEGAAPLRNGSRVEVVLVRRPAARWCRRTRGRAARTRRGPSAGSTRTRHLAREVLAGEGLQEARGVPSRAGCSRCLRGADSRAARGLPVLAAGVVRRRRRIPRRSRRAMSPGGRVPVGRRRLGTRVHVRPRLRRRLAFDVEEVDAVEVAARAVEARAAQEGHWCSVRRSDIEPLNGVAERADWSRVARPEVGLLLRAQGVGQAVVRGDGARPRRRAQPDQGRVSGEGRGCFRARRAVRRIQRNGDLGGLADVADDQVSVVVAGPAPLPASTWLSYTVAKGGQDGRGVERLGAVEERERRRPRSPPRAPRPPSRRRSTRTGTG